VVVRAGGASSQVDVHLFVGRSASTPEDVVRAALETQVRGDVDGMLEHIALSDYPQRNQQEAREVFAAVRDRATFSNFEFTHLATTTDPEATIAFVRSISAFRVQTAEGQFDLRNGQISALKKVDGKWKILEIGPDELLNQEIYEDSQGNGSRYMRNGVAPYDIKSLNRHVTEAMKGLYIDKTKAGLAVYFGIVGKVPGVGDSVANIYQVADLLVNAKELITELRDYGPRQLALLKLKSIGLGVLQIATEPVPGLDTMSDLAAAGTEQLTANLEKARALNEFRAYVQTQIVDSKSLDPHVFLWETYDYPDGTFTERALISDLHSYAWGSPDPLLLVRTPIRSIRFEDPKALDAKIAFRVVGEISVDVGSHMEPIFRKLTALPRGQKLYIPVDVGYLVSNLIVTGDEVLEDLKPASNRAIVGTVTCRLETQSIRVELRNGEISPAVVVGNRFMGAIQTLTIDRVWEAIPIEVSVGGEFSGFRVFGITGSTPFSPRDESSVDLTNRPKCLDITMGDDTIATVARGETATIAGVKEGETTLDLRLHETKTINIPDITDSFEVVVAPENGIVDWLSKSTHAVARFTGDHFCKDSWGGVGECFSGSGLSGMQLQNHPTIPLEWRGTEFTVKGPYNFTYAGLPATGTVDFHGTVSGDGMKLLEGRFRWDYSWVWESETTSRTFSILVKNLPLTNPEDAEPCTNCFLEYKADSVARTGEPGPDEPSVEVLEATQSYNGELRKTYDTTRADRWNYVYVKFIR
jgi:hypothetical protein